jgi:hypothetical protein
MSGNSTRIQFNSTSAWSGDAGTSFGKLEYHAQRWYVNAGSNSDRIVQFRRAGSDVSHIDNSGNYQGNVVGSISGGNVSGGTGTFTGSITCTGTEIAMGSFNTVGAVSKYVGVSGGGYSLGGMEIENTTLNGNWSQKVHFRTHYYNVSNGRRMTINEAGNVGIGNESPGYKLHVAGDIYANGGSLRVSGNNGLYFESWGGGWYMSDSTFIRATGDKWVYTSGQIRCAGGFSVSDGTVIVDNSRNHYGYFKFYTDTWEHRSTDNFQRFYFANGGRTYQKSPNGHEFQRNSDGAWIMILNDNLSTDLRSTVRIAGGCSVGKSSDPTFTLDVNGSLKATGQTILPASYNGAHVIGASAGGNNSQSGVLQVVGIANALLAIGTSMNATGDQIHVQFNNPNGPVGAIKTTGSTTSYTSVSDYRLKSNVSQMTNGLDIINKLKPVYFSFNADPITKCAGFIAHILQDVVPAAVSGIKDDINEDGTIKPQGVDTSLLISYLVSSVKELSARILALESKTT